jgi:phosphoribosylglycinamide formyltransferase-1
VENRPVPHLAVLISGRGSNLAAIADAIDAGRLRARIGVVISNRPDAPGLAHARTHGVPTVIERHGDFPSRAAYDAALAAALEPYRVRFVCLAGFMRLLGPTFCEAFRTRS